MHVHSHSLTLSQSAHAVENVAAVVQAVGSVQKVFKDQKQKENCCQFQLRKTRETIGLFRTMLNRVSKSQNRDLIDDVNIMKLPEKLEYIVSWSGKILYQKLCRRQKDWI
ncbi:hypothetical protein L3Y34_006687 [Caenorhabditis briggsae]|uniref:Alpha-carbonic anhydrase domain-containing protein n=1 Tax=Caenorhabditis briggsae TaxID=6238 RepID=A0AAE8ZXE8_CAEBR|nr:hypothetical protein L3Y34_006687 [Caenorhabditis briggsae]